MPPIDEPQQAIGAAVKTVRERRRLSQKQLSRQAEVDRAGLGRLEKGETNPSWAMLRRLAAALNVKPTTIVALSEAIEEEQKAERNPPQP